MLGESTAHTQPIMPGMNTTELVIWSAMLGALVTLASFAMVDALIRRSIASWRAFVFVAVTGAVCILLTGLMQALLPNLPQSLVHVLQNSLGPLAGALSLSYLGLWLGRATEDRVVGTLDIEKAIQKGERHFEPGVLASANRGLLYIDEVNLLDDHVVDILLDSAAMGVNTVEREGISFAHPARFILVGTMNPEEGDLRPQLLDRFALSVEIVGIREERR